MTKLELIRRNRKIFRTDLSRISSVGESTIYEAEKGIKSPKVETMQRLVVGINYLSEKKGYEPITLDDICEEPKTLPATLKLYRETTVVT